MISAASRSVKPSSLVSQREASLVAVPAAQDARLQHDGLARAERPDLMRPDCPDLLCADTAKPLCQLAMGYGLHTSTSSP
jgi:hypothetical protein